MLEIDHDWTSAGSSGGLASVQVGGVATESVLYCEYSTLAGTQAVVFQTSVTSSGPWVSESSRTIAADPAGAIALRLTGPYLWARPYLKAASAGTYRFRLIGVGGSG